LARDRALASALRGREDRGADAAPRG
jgi:hypothetical protein